jgi:Na+/H+-translocating membrane pyrophosphatase
MIVYWFVGLSVAAVGRTAGEVVKEVRRQFRCVPCVCVCRIVVSTYARFNFDQPLSSSFSVVSHHTLATSPQNSNKLAQSPTPTKPNQNSDNPDIMTFKARPDHRTCVALVTSAALQEMVLPGLLATGLPIVVGLVFRGIGALTDRPMLGAEALAGYLRCVRCLVSVSWSVCGGVGECGQRLGGLCGVSAAL